MREIKFRAYNSETNNFELKASLRNLLVIFQTPLGVKTEKWLWQQYTGLKDKNGKEIYEGDICIHQQLAGGLLEPNPVKGVQIVWTELHNGWICDDGKYQYSMQSSQLEIVGNIFQNPELLKSNFKAKNKITGEIVEFIKVYPDTYVFADSRVIIPTFRFNELYE